MKNKLSILTILSLILSFTVSAEENSTDNNGSKAKESKSCGVITLYNKPPSTKNIHYASINSIDGHTVSESARSFTLTPGKHVIKVMEHIDEEWLTRRRDKAQNFHFIEFNVEANKKYSLGAKYIRKNRSKISNGGYWTPEVWKTSNVECKV